MGNRPIQRRPWRKKPWAKGANVTRWNASTGGCNLGLVDWTTVYPCTLDETAEKQPIAVIANGQVDVEPWADDQQVVIDRIVGDIHLAGYATYGLNAGPLQLPLIKLGILMDKDLSSNAATEEVPTHSLWEQEDLEDLSWMWLHSCFPGNLTERAVDAGYVVNFAHSIHVDIGVRRKMGQRDELNLYASWAASTSGFFIQVLSYTDLRCIMMSK